jgi:hypothetical protein
MTKETKQAFDDHFAREMTETAEGMRRVGAMDETAHKLTVRDLKRAAPDETVMRGGWIASVFAHSPMGDGSASLRKQ